MKPVIILASLLAASNAMALDFDSEWSKFDADFARMKGVTVAKYQPSKPVVSKIDDEVMEDVPKYNPRSTKNEVLPEKPSADNVLERVDPKSSERLGHKLEDEAMRKHVQNLYKKPDTVVYSLTLTE